LSVIDSRYFFMWILWSGYTSRWKSTFSTCVKNVFSVCRKCVRLTLENRPAPVGRWIY